MGDAPYSVLVLGLDGATFDLMLPWIDEGRLPTLSGILRQGAWSRLRSTIPPITPCAWSSFMTGKNPGKHGLFDFVEPTPGGRGMRFTNASSRCGETLWGYLSRLGRTVGVLNVPMTYPPEPVNGYQVSGLDTPSERSRFTHPQELRAELDANAAGWRIDVQHLGNMRTDARRNACLQELCAVETVRTRALQHLQRRYPSDFTMLVYTATDQVQHHFWHYMDQRHDKHDAAGAVKYKNAIRDVYVHLDGLIADVLRERGDDTIVVLMSDHGFGPTSNVRLRLNQALEHSGLLTFQKEGTAGWLRRALGGAADRVLRSTLSNDMKRRLADWFPGLRTWFESVDEARIDWERTQAYTNEAFRACPAVWINRQNASGNNEARLRAAEAMLRGLKDPQTGRSVVGDVHCTRELYTGPYVDNAPDLIPTWWDDGFLLEQSRPGAPAATDVERSTAPIQGGVEFAGSHRLDGVFAIAGGPARQNHAFEGAQIIDVAPTVLYLMGLPIPADMDGRPLLEAIDPEFVASHPPRYEQDGTVPPEPAAVGSVFTAREEEQIAERLRAMGYIE